MKSIHNYGNLIHHHPNKVIVVCIIAYKNFGERGKFAVEWPMKESFFTLTENDS